jgi:hypothetical protein
MANVWSDFNDYPPPEFQKDRKHLGSHEAQSNVIHVVSPEELPALSQEKRIELVNPQPDCHSLNLAKNFTCWPFQAISQYRGPYPTTPA